MSETHRRTKIESPSVSSLEEATVAERQEKEQQETWMREVNVSLLVGLCPSYFAQVPMAVAQIHHLGLIRGIDCLLPVTQSGGNGHPNKCIPVSKCEFWRVWTANTMDPIYISLTMDLDTFWIVWTGLTVRSIGCRVLLLTMTIFFISRTNDLIPFLSYKVGDVVRTFGRIKVVEIGSARGKHGRRHIAGCCP